MRTEWYFGIVSCFGRSFISSITRTELSHRTRTMLYVCSHWNLISTFSRMHQKFFDLFTLPIAFWCLWLMPDRSSENIYLLIHRECPFPEAKKYACCVVHKNRFLQGHTDIQVDRLDLIRIHHYFVFYASGSLVFQQAQ